MQFTLLIEHRVKGAGIADGFEPLSFLIKFRVSVTSLLGNVASHRNFSSHFDLHFQIHFKYISNERISKVVQHPSLGFLKFSPT
jgi:hypothetical protein